MKGLQAITRTEICIQLTQAQEVTADMLNRSVSFIAAKPKTVETYYKSLKQFFKYMQDNAIVRPQRINIIAFRDYLETFCKPSTIQSYVIAVRLFFKWTSAEGLYPNVAENIKGARLDKKHKKDYLTSWQIKTVLAGVDKRGVKGKRNYAILTLMITGGLRTIEVVRANFEDLRTVGDSGALYIQGKGRDCSLKNKYNESV